MGREGSCSGVSWGAEEDGARCGWAAWKSASWDADAGLVFGWGDGGDMDLVGSGLLSEEDDDHSQPMLSGDHKAALGLSLCFKKLVS